ncbi:MAG: protein kinase [Phycisphaeraceae bacterium]|nr:protein kinase [Phycisphaeraceae bacterium]
MAICLKCKFNLPDEARFCSNCGTPVVDLANAETAEFVRPRANMAASPGGASPNAGAGVATPGLSGDPKSRAASFQPGTVLGDRYRIVALLGRGAMGEVYRAEDLRLAQDVALKFFFHEGVDPEVVAERMRKLSAEVRLAREVTHPNVCRVHDLTELEVEGTSGERMRLPVLSMEYVVGDDLAGLLKKIGRMPSGKAIEIARQLCSGLAAAHAKGIIHRDLKPANIMIDAVGTAKITDFGLAGWASDLAESQKAAGTPRYMAPEILQRGGGNEQSDLYSLGLVLHEMLTGKQVFEATNLKELLQGHQASIPPPSLVARHADPRLEAAIMRCIEPDPAMRPRSALEVIAMLPGGDPLAAALAAGVTPSVATIAGATALKRMQVRTIGLVGLSLVALLALVVWLVPQILLVNQLPLDKPPAVLADRAREILKSLGYTPTVENSVYRLDVFDEYLDLIEQKEKGVDVWRRLGRLRPGAMDFWYRQFPVAVRPQVADGVVTWDDPRPIGGSIGLRLDLAGHLRELRAVPDGAGDDLAAAEKLEKGFVGKRTVNPDPRPVFLAAGLDFDTFRPVPPMRVPQVYADLFQAWEGVYPESPDTTVRAELAWYEGRPVSFRTLEPAFATTFKDLAANTPGRVSLANAIEATLRIGSLVVASFLAWMNFRYRRGDGAGARRIALFMGALMMLSVLCRADVLSNSSEGMFDFRRGAIGVVFSALEGGVFVGLSVWVAYFALEPYARRFWPETLIAWSRLLLGRFFDPEVGRSTAIGAVAGCLVVVAHSLQHLCGPWIGYPTLRPMTDDIGGAATLEGVRSIAGVLCIHAMDACIYGMSFLLGIVLLSLLFKNRRYALSVYAVLQTAIFGLAAANNPLGWVFAALMTAIVTIVLLRYGLLALVVGAFVFKVCTTFPITTNTNAWYFGIGAFAVALVGAIGLWGLIVAARSPTQGSLKRI